MSMEQEEEHCDEPNWRTKKTRNIAVINDTSSYNNVSHQGIYKSEN